MRSEQNDLADMSGSRYAPSVRQGFEYGLNRTQHCLSENPAMSVPTTANRLKLIHPESFSIGIFCAGVLRRRNRRLVSEQVFHLESQL